MDTIRLRRRKPLSYPSKCTSIKKCGENETSGLRSDAIAYTTESISSNMNDINNHTDTLDDTTDHIVIRDLFFRLLGLVHIYVFLSIYFYGSGLIGSDGISPIVSWFNNEKILPTDADMITFPTIFWLLDTSDFSILHISLLGFGGGIIQVFGFEAVIISVIQYILYLSYMTTAPEIFVFQWDALLLEVNFLAIFFSSRLFPWSSEWEPNITVIWLYRFLVCRLMFSSGMIKIISQDESWSNCSALEGHYESQPVPTWMAWYIAKLPIYFHRICCQIFLLMEIGMPFSHISIIPFIRKMGAISTWITQICISIAGHYSFFNVLTSVIVLPTLQDGDVPQWFNRRLKSHKHLLSNRKKLLRAGLFQTLVSYFIVIIILAAAIMPTVMLFGTQPNEVPSALKTYTKLLEPYRIVNMYGLFSAMHKGRLDVRLEGSTDNGRTWQTFRYSLRPAIDISPLPHSSFALLLNPSLILDRRLDYLVWFLPFSKPDNFPWFSKLIQGLLDGNKYIYALFGQEHQVDYVWNASQQEQRVDGHKGKYYFNHKHPPQCIRASLHLRRFTSDYYVPNDQKYVSFHRGIYIPIKCKEQ